MILINACHRTRSGNWKQFDAMLFAPGRQSTTPDLWSKRRSFEMTETLARSVAPAAEERARLKEGVHIEREFLRPGTDVLW